MCMLMKNMDDILRNYWEGKTSPEEENTLKEHLGKDDNSDVEATYFNYLKSKKQEKITSPDFDKKILDFIDKEQFKHKKLHITKFWQYAAAVIVLVSLSILFINRSGNFNKVNPSKNLTFVDTYEDPQKAFEETKRALLLISTNLNKGQEYTEHLVKFSETQEKLKN